MLLQGLWKSKFDLKKSNDILLESAFEFEQIFEDEVNYFSVNCFLEIGNNFLKLDKKDFALGFLEKAKDYFIKLFGEDHSMMQKYYSYATEYASYIEDNDLMLENA
jgi:hypothetical protein